MGAAHSSNFGYFPNTPFNKQAEVGIDLLGLA
jgi:hypothetical protein